MLVVGAVEGVGPTAMYLTMYFTSAGSSQGQAGWKSQKMSKEKCNFSLWVPLLSSPWSLRESFEFHNRVKSCSLTGNLHFALDPEPSGTHCVLLRDSY